MRQLATNLGVAHRVQHRAQAAKLVARLVGGDGTSLGLHLGRNLRSILAPLEAKANNDQHDLVQRDFEREYIEGIVLDRCLRETGDEHFGQLGAHGQLLEGLLLLLLGAT